MKDSDKTAQPEEKVSPVAKKELEILAFWEKEKIFEQTLENTKGNDSFVFYDGPPFATGLPHYGHLLAGTIKDAIPRYQTMKGKYVRRKWGWDCHGLPVENLIENELGLNNKQDIEEYGIEKFNSAACNSVLRYDKEWKEIVPRMGRWIDMEESYKTMDWQYSESIWWAFKQLHDAGHIYEGYKAMHVCPRCETTLSNNEVSDGYKDIKDISVTAKFELVDEPGTFVLAWTTTPWTLPGNVALAVGGDVEYVQVKMEDGQYILAKERVEDVLKDSQYEIIKELKGKDLIGKSYKPLFDYYSKNAELENHSNGWKIYSADFVTTEDGTGVVHIAPAFGEDDMSLGKENELPFVQHVTMSGHFKPEVTDFAGLLVKPKDDKETKADHMSTDIEMVKYLAHNGKLFSKEKYEHSYPHCWRCKTPLLNYAASSWFVKVSDFKDKLIEQNKTISWVPEAIKEGRFGKWLEGARDWAISRSRYWGAPFPVWKCDSCEEQYVAGSIADITKKTKSTNTITVIRHGEADSNVKKIISSNVDSPNHLTENGKEQVKASAKELKDAGIDMIIASPFVRTKETAELVAAELGLATTDIIYDSRIQEPDFGDFEGKSVAEYHACFTSDEDRFTRDCPGGENLTDVKKRAGDFLYDIDSKYEGKNILVVSHDYPSWLMQTVVKGLDIKDSAKVKGEMYLDNAQICPLPFAPMPHNGKHELDMHRPYIDDVHFPCGCGGEMARIKDVFDCWFESGSMPYAQLHYPFENKDEFKRNFPADFIAEGLDQTRGWFYNMLVLGTGNPELAQTPFKNVIVNGIVLAEDGQKMSKSEKNYPDPMLMVNKYGADALRYYMLASPIVRGEPLNFSEKGVGEVYRKVVVRLENVLSFYLMFAERNEGKVVAIESPNVLDEWIIARLAQVNSLVGENMESYHLDRAVRPIGDFVDDLSTWYVRRSRTRVKGQGDDTQYALATLKMILEEFSKIIAPIMPFTAESVYKKVCDADGITSVHLNNWPIAEKYDEDRLSEMTEVRSMVSLALEKRAIAGMKVRQPLSSLKIKSEILKGKNELLGLISEEVNVKEILIDSDMVDSTELSLELTPELIAEGQFRELVRNIQGLRKKTGLTPDDQVEIQINTDEKGEGLIETFKEDLMKTSLISKVIFTENDGEDITVDDMSFSITLIK